MSGLGNIVVSYTIEMLSRLRWVGVDFKQP